jgi:hypothetical protein
MLHYLDNHAINDGSLSFLFDPSHRTKSSETGRGAKRSRKRRQKSGEILGKLTGIR